MDKIGIGLDFGNSNSALALFDGEEVTYVPLENDSSPFIMASALYLDRDIMPTLGRSAIARYLEENAGRKITLEKASLGLLTMYMGEMDRDHIEWRDRTTTSRIHAYVDKDIPGRLFCSLKGYLGNEGIQSFDVFGRKFRVEPLVTILLNGIKQGYTTHTGNELQSLHVGRPVVYAGTADDTNALAISRMDKAFSNCGVTGHTYMFEPIGAATSYFHSHEGGSGQKVLVFDFGGGTLDLCVLEGEKHDFTVLSTYGLPEAGDFIDRLIYRKKLFPQLGEGVIVHSKNDSGNVSHRFPFSEYADNLLNWQSTYIMNQPQYIEQINRVAKQGGEAGSKLDTLKALIRNNASFHLLKAIENAKVTLSSRDEARIVVEEIGFETIITRREFEGYLETFLYRIEDSVKKVVAAAGLDSLRGIDKVVCTGGSSQIPVVKDLLESLFPHALEEYDPFRSIAAGLAMANFYKNG